MNCEVIRNILDSQGFFHIRGNILRKDLFIEIKFHIIAELINQKPTL